MTTHKPLEKSSYNVVKFFPMANQKHPEIFQSTTFSSTYHRQKGKIINYFMFHFKFYKVWTCNFVLLWVSSIDTDAQISH